MKSTIILFSALFIVSISNAQIKPGVKAGGNISTFTTSKHFLADVEENRQAGFYFGLNTKAALNEKFSLLLELMYAQKGAKSLPFISDDKLKLSYLNVPVLLNYSPLNRLNLYLGPEIGILIDAKIRNPNREFDANPFFQTFDLGLATGVSFDLIKGLYLDARFVEGLTRIQEGLFGEVSFNQGGNQLERSGRNRSIQFGVGYRFL